DVHDQSKNNPDGDAPYASPVLCALDWCVGRRTVSDADTFPDLKAALDATDPYPFGLKGLGGLEAFESELHPLREPTTTTVLLQPATTTTTVLIQPATTTTTVLLQQPTTTTVLLHPQQQPTTTTATVLLAPAIGLQQQQHQPQQQRQPQLQPTIPTTTVLLAPATTSTYSGGHLYHSGISLAPFPTAPPLHPQLGGRRLI
ncbi:unnamed protein product, partial [Polarella glacialis]